MLLSDGDLRAAIAAGDLAVEPLGADAFQPASIDVRVSHEFRVTPAHQHAYSDPLDLAEDHTVLVEVVPEGLPFILHPGQFVLGATVEFITLSPALAARLEGKSTLGRLGLMTHSTAGWIDPGFAGQVTLELSNVSTLPVKIWPGMKIGQLCVFRCSSPAERPYTGRYQGQKGPVAARMRP